MKNAYNKSKYIRPTLRATVLIALFVGPFAGFAVAAANDNVNQNRGAGFVIYVSLMRS